MNKCDAMNLTNSVAGDTHGWDRGQTGWVRICVYMFLVSTYVVFFYYFIGFLLIGFVYDRPIS